MDEQRPREQIVGPDVVASVIGTMSVATLRYFESAGAFAESVRAATGGTLPGPLEAREVSQGQLILAWRSPTETLCLARSAAPLAQLRARLDATTGGCAVELTGGLCILRLSGDRSADLLCRLGGSASVPMPGESRRSRLADVAVLALSVRVGETFLAVDRGYLPHLLAWIRETLLDFDAVY